MTRIAFARVPSECPVPNCPRYWLATGCAVPARQVLAEEGLELAQLKVPGVREMFFSKGERAALCRPADLVYESGPDELNRGRLKLILQFDLPRGSYATLLIKRLGGSSEVLAKE